MLTVSSVLSKINANSLTVAQYYSAEAGVFEMAKTRKKSATVSWSFVSTPPPTSAHQSETDQGKAEAASFSDSRFDSNGIR